MAATQSTLMPWKGCTIPAPRAPDNTVQPCTLEFTIVGPNGDEDHPFGGGRYKLAGPGGYKLSTGLLRPFPQACRPPIMLVRFCTTAPGVASGGDCPAQCWPFRCCNAAYMLNRLQIDRTVHD